MHIAKVPNRNARPSFLLRETYRENGKVKNRTLANLSKLPIERIETLRAALRGDPLVPIGSNGFEIRRSLPHGHVLAALTIARRIGLDELLPRRAPQRRRDVALALIVARLLDPAAKLATARMLDTDTASHSLGETLGLGSVTAREIYTTLDWLGREQNSSKTNSLGATLRTAHWCSTTSPPPTSRDAAVRWPSTATAATAAVTGRNW